MSKLTDKQNAALNIDTSCSVTASAGTGKTFLLKKRYVELLKQKSGLKPENILCLTFTDKAAAEMREKIEDELRKEQKAHPDNKNLKSALENMYQCKISTFHGFCSALLKEFPIEAGIHTGFSIMDDFDRNELVHEAMKEVLQNPPAEIHDDAVRLFTISDSEQILENIEYIMKNWNKCSSWFEMIDENRSAVLEKYDEAYQLFLEKKVQKIINDPRFTTYFEIIKDERYQTHKKVAQNYAICLALLNADTTEKYEAALNAAKSFSDTKGSKEYAIDPGVKNDFKKCINPLKDKKKQKSLQRPSSTDAKKQEYYFNILKAYRNTAKYCRTYIDEKKSEGGYLSFDDLIEKTLLLMENTQVTDTLKKRFRYILVDEVQDNNPALTEIVTALSGDLNSEHKLFIVGDLKQSIYGFNNADPKRVQNLMKKFGHQVELDTNFRTLEGLQNLINKVFQAIYPNTEEKKEDAIIYPENLEANRKNERARISLIKEIYPDKTKANVYYSLEAELIASWIKKAHSSKLQVFEEDKSLASGGRWRDVQYRDIAVLVKARTNNQFLKNAFAKYQIPCQEYKGRNFFGLQETADILSVIKACVCPEDDIALYGALKSPYFGISDEEIASVVFPARKKSLSLFEILQNADNTDNANNENYENIKEAVQLLSSLKEEAVSLPLMLFLRDVVRKTGILSVYSALENGSDKTANLNKFLNLAEERSSSKSISIFEFIRIMESSIENSIEEEEGAVSADADEEDKVKILTIHASKGLEYPVVILAFGGKKPYIPFTNILYDENFGAVYTPLHMPNDTKKEKETLFYPVSEIIKMNLTEEELEEEKRVFYVGMTRARDHLVLSSSVKEKVPETEKKNTKNSPDDIAETNETETDESEIDEQKTDNPETDEPDIDESETDNQETNEPETHTKTETRQAYEAGPPNENSFLAYFEKCSPNTDDFGCCMLYPYENSEECGSKLPVMPENWSSLSLSDKEEEETEEKEKGYSETEVSAAARGLCLHEIFAGADIKRTCAKYGGAVSIKEAEQALQEFLSCGLIHPETGDSLCELPVYSPENGSRRIDRLYRRSDGTYLIIDYKTGDGWKDPHVLEEYCTQVRDYAAMISRITHVEKTRAVLYFADEP